jgi:TonB family protein
MNFLNYYLESSRSLAFLIAVYSLLLKNETNFSVRRFYLVGSIFVSLILPLINFQNETVQQVLPSIEEVVPTAWLPELTIGGYTHNTTSETGDFNWLNWLTLLYWGVAALLIPIFIFQLARLLKYFFQHEKYEWQNCWVAESNQLKPTFSFFNFIFIGQANLLSPNEKTAILHHEKVHVKKLHSLDILFVMLVKVIWWFHPAVYFIHQELVRLHEFEADAESVKSKDVNEYCGLLAKVALQEISYPLGSHFSNSLTIKRINMMKAVKQSIRSWKIMMVAIACTIIAVAIGCQDQIAGNREKQLKESEWPKEVATQLRRLKLMSPTSNFIVKEFANGEEMDAYVKENPKAALPFVTVGNRNIAIIEPNGFFKYPSKNESKVFSVVDEIATPVLGIDGLYEQLSYALQYPENARINKIEGKVYLEFVVQTDGTISDAKVIRGLEEEIDTEALRALYQVGDKWYPAIHHGQLVKMKMVLPIVFSLAGNATPRTETVDSNFLNIEPSFGYDNKLNSNNKHLIEGIVQGNQGVLPGAKIQVKNTTEGAYAASDGKFFLETTQESGILVFSFPGFKTTEILFNK